MKKKKYRLIRLSTCKEKKTGMLFQFCCLAPVIIAKKELYYHKFEKIGSDIGLIFQIVDDLIDHKGISKKVGKKTRKDQKKGKATLISLLGYENTINYSNNLKKKIFDNLKKFGNKADELKKTINFVLSRSK